MVQFAATYPDEPIVVTLSRQLSWSHFVALLPLKDPPQRDYYVSPTGRILRPVPRASPAGAHTPLPAQSATDADSTRPGRTARVRFVK